MTKYLYVYNDKKSKDFVLARNCVKAGAAEVKRDWNTKYSAGLVGENLGMPRDFLSARGRALDLLRSKPLGTVIRLTRLDQDDKPVDGVRFRKTDPAPKIPDTEGVIGIDRICGWVNTESRAGRLKGVRYAGICVCKPDSDHRDCAAVDIFATWESMEKIEREFWSKPDYYNAKYSILGTTIRFFNHAEHYTGDFHAHNHLSVNGGIPGKAC